jgi:glycosyltransferase involved in cell wall biosynthesis
MRHKLVRITTVPASLDKLLEGQLKFINEHFEVIAVSSNRKALNDFGQKEGLRTFPVNMTRKITPLNDLMALWQMYCFLNREKPLIVHSHTPKAGLIGMLAAFLARVPYRLHTVAGLPLLETSGIRRRVLNWVEWLTYACATKVYPNSHGLKNIIIDQKFCNSKKLEVIANGSSNGIDTDYFHPELFSSAKLSFRSNWGINPEDFVFIFLGRLVADKGLNELVTAFTQLYQGNSNVKLLLIGDYESDLDPLDNNTILAIQNTSNIMAAGFQKDVRPFLAMSDALVFPSYREGFPNVVLQALAMGLPAIVSDINGCNELVQNNYNGLIVPAKSLSDLKMKMSDLYENNELLNFLSSNARVSVLENYQRNKVWHAILDEYKKIIL